IENLAADLVSNFDKGQIARKDRRQYRVFACRAVVKGTQIETRGAGRLGLHVCKIDDDVRFAVGPLMCTASILADSVGPTGTPIAEQHSFEFEQRLQTGRPRRSRPYPGDLNIDMAVIKKRSQTSHPGARPLVIKSKFNNHDWAPSRLDKERPQAF